MYYILYIYIYTYIYIYIIFIYIYILYIWGFPFRHRGNPPTHHPNNRWDCNINQPAIGVSPYDELESPKHGVGELMSLGINFFWWISQWIHSRFRDVISNRYLKGCHPPWFARHGTGFLIKVGQVGVMNTNSLGASTYWWPTCPKVINRKHGFQRTEWSNGGFLSDLVLPNFQPNAFFPSHRPRAVLPDLCMIIISLRVSLLKTAAPSLTSSS